MNLKFEGIYSPTITPYDSEGNVDLDRLRDYLDFLLENGINGLFMLGTNGEGPLLQLEEKRKIIETSVDHVDGEVPVVAGTACPSTREAVKMCKFAEKVGADAVHSVVPYFYPTSGKSLVRHYTRVAESTDLPVFVYHIPSRTGNLVDVDTLVELSELDNVVGLKDSSKNIGWFHECLTRIGGGNFSFFAGSDAYIYPYLSLGADGAVSAVANAFPELVTKLYRRFEADELEAAAEIQNKVMKVRRELKRGPYMSGVKATLDLRGMDFGPLRSPLAAMRREEKAELEMSLEELDLI